MTIDEFPEADEESEGVDVLQSETNLANASDFWVGLLVIGGTCYGLLAVAKIIFF